MWQRCPRCVRGVQGGDCLPAYAGCHRLTYLARLDRLPDGGIINLWNSAGTIDEVVVRVGRVPRLAVVALRKGGNELKTFARATLKSPPP